MVGTGAVVGTANLKKCVIKVTLASFQTNTMFVIAYNSQCKAVIEKKDGSSNIGKKVFSTVLEVLCEFSSWAWIRAKLREGKIHFIIFSFLFV